MVRSAAIIGLLCAACGGAGGRDAGRNEDAGHDEDAGRDHDAGPATDAGSSDAGSRDDAGSMDAGSSDAGSSDAGSSDAESTGDAGSTDASVMCGVGALDQSQLVADDNDGIEVRVGGAVGQTFTVGVSGRLSAIELSLVRDVVPEAGDIVRLSVYDMASALLGSATLETSSIVSGAEASDLEATVIGVGLFDLCPAGIDVTSGMQLSYRVTREGTTGVCLSVFGSPGECGGGSRPLGSPCDADYECDARVGHGHTSSDLYPGGADRFRAGDLAFKIFVD